MGFYDHEDNVKKYIDMSKAYDGKDLDLYENDSLYIVGRLK